MDLGISHPQSGGPLKIWQVESANSGKPGKSVDVAKATSALLERDRMFSAESAKQGVAAAFSKYAAPDTRLYLPQSLPFVGKASSIEALKKKGLVTYRVIAGDVSRSGDLGYTHGSYEKSSADDPKKVDEVGNYVRIWQKVNGAWQIVLEVSNPVQ